MVGADTNEGDELAHCAWQKHRSCQGRFRAKASGHGPTGLWLRYSVFQRRTESKGNGTVKTLTDRGYGFIAQADGTDLFFHRSQVAGGGFDRLVVGQAVTYEKGVSSRNNKEEAQNVTPS